MTAYTDKERIRRIDSIIAFLSFVREQVDRYLTPVSEIIRRCNPEILTGCFRGTEMPPSRPSDMPGLLGAVCTGDYAGDGKAALLSFAARFGRSFGDREVQSCSECIAELTKLRASLAAELPRRRREHTVVGLCAAAMAVIIML